MASSTPFLFTSPSSQLRQALESMRAIQDEKVSARRAWKEAQQARLRTATTAMSDATAYMMADDAVAEASIRMLEVVLQEALVGVEARACARRTREWERKRIEWVAFGVLLAACMGLVWWL